jgi:hypothetical protein
VFLICLKIYSSFNQSVFQQELGAFICPHVLCNLDSNLC